MVFLLSLLMMVMFQQQQQQQLLLLLLLLPHRASATHTQLWGYIALRVAGWLAGWLMVHIHTGTSGVNNTEVAEQYLVPAVPGKRLQQDDDVDALPFPCPSLPSCLGTKILQYHVPNIRNSTQE